MREVVLSIYLGLTLDISRDVVTYSVFLLSYMEYSFQAVAGRNTNMQYYASFEEASCIYKLQSWVEKDTALLEKDI